MEVVIECFPFHFQVPFHTITIVLKCCIVKRSGVRDCSDSLATCLGCSPHPMTNGIGFSPSVTLS